MVFVRVFWERAKQKIEGIAGQPPLSHMATCQLWLVSRSVGLHSRLTFVSIAGQLSASTVIMVGIALLMSVSAINVYSKKDSSEQVPRWCIAIVSRFYPTGSGNATALCKIDRIRNGMEESPEVGGERINEDWIFVAKFLDRICFWVYVVLTVSLFVGLAIQVA